MTEKEEKKELTPEEKKAWHLKQSREKDIQAELNFWTRALGEDITDDMKARLNRASKLPEKMIDILTNRPSQLVLDIGSGPLSALGSVQDMGLDHQLIAIDPLANAYKEILKENNLQPNCLLLESEGENLQRLEIFREQGDIVWMCNAMDHSRDPHGVWENLKMMVKPGGYLFFVTHVKEADRGNFQGMHKVNLWWENEDLYYNVLDGPTFTLIWRKDFDLISVKQSPNEKGIQVLTLVLRKKENYDE